MVERSRVGTGEAPAAIGPYSQGIVAGEFVFVSGQIALDPATGEMSGSDAAAQTDRVMKNVGAILRAAGSSFDRVVKTTIFLADLADFEAVNRVYASYLGEDPPARATVQVSALPKGALVEVEVTALKAL